MHRNGIAKIERPVYEHYFNLDGEKHAYFFLVCTVFWLIMDPNLIQKIDQISVCLATFCLIEFLF